MGSLRLAIKRSLDEDEVKQNPSSKNSPTKKRSTATTSPTTVTLIPQKSKKKGNKKRKKSLSTKLNNAASVKGVDEAAAVVQPPKIKIRLGIKKKSTNKVSAKPNTAPHIGEVGYEFRKQFNNKRWYSGKIAEIRPLAGKFSFNHCSKNL